MEEQLLDKRYKQTIDYLTTGKGEPVYKKNAFPFINKILGPQFKWINKSVEEYYSTDQIQEAKQAMRILSFSGEESFQELRKRYTLLSRGKNKENIPGFHPDCGGHSRAFDILNRAYSIFKEADD